MRDTGGRMRPISRGSLCSPPRFTRGALPGRTIPRVTSHSRLAGCILLVVLALAACANDPTRPDLGRLYRVGATFSDTTPVILIPGVFGSKLRDRGTGSEVWPGTTRMILFGDYRDLALDFDPSTLAVRPDNLEAFDVTDAAL